MCNRDAPLSLYAIKRYEHGDSEGTNRVTQHILSHASDTFSMSVNSKNVSTFT